ncbi:MAG: LysR family transcriptional regulator [Rhodospirillales bacterium 20-60-12]|nr:MAG: LysR family transcriptional regulator [Rhodospirillales bacterium 20-60-12]HQT66530.1 LysR family transcriptional regulator [Acetobacteraceae bacterium]
MTLEQLRVFVAVAERQHMTRAAAHLNLTQSAASAAIASLERGFSTRLFHRVGRGITLTEAGTLLLSEARMVLSRAAAAETAMAEFLGLGRGRLAIQASQTIASYLLPRLLVQFHDAYPGIELAVSLGNTAQVARSVADGVVELGFIEGPTADPSLALEKIGEDRLVLVVGKFHAWAGRKTLSVAELQGANWVVREAGSGTRAALRPSLASLGLDIEQLRISIELPANEAVLAAVVQNAGVGLLSAMVCADALANGQLKELPVVLPKRDFYAVQHNDRFRSRTAAALLALIRGSAKGDM